MKKIFLSLFVIAAITTGKAQTAREPGTTDNSSGEYRHEKSNHGKHGKMHGHELAKTLNFTDAQKQQLKSIDEDYKSRVQALDKSSNMSAGELKSKKADLKKEKMQKTMALLTPEQKTALQNLKKEQGQNGEMNQAKQMEKMRSYLNLSDDQVAKIKAQKETFTSKKESIRNNQSLTMEQKKEQMKALKEEEMNNYKSFLTPDQVKKMEEMKHRKPVKTA